MMGGIEIEKLRLNATDRVKVDLILASGLMVPDYEVNRSVAKQNLLSLEVNKDWVVRPGSIIRIQGDSVWFSFDLPPDEISEEKGRVTIVGIRRTIQVEFEEEILVQLVHGLCQGSTITELISRMSQRHHDVVREVLCNLIAWGAVLSKLEARSRLSHEWSMRGGNSRGLLSPSEIVAITLEANHRENSISEFINLSSLRPFPIDSLFKVLQQRRSQTSYNKAFISLDDLSQLLGGACGITGELAMSDQSLGLRAYPSPGALYGVDIYVIPTRVKDLSHGVFRYDPKNHGLERIHDRPIDVSSFCLPDTRTVVSGIATFIALSISISRAALKYGDVTYRILVAEAGCIAENLVLVAHALGLRAGPFTGVFDSLVDQAIGLDKEKTRFVVGVLIGHKDE